MKGIVTVQSQSCGALTFLKTVSLCLAGLPDGAKYGKYCQKSVFSKTFANFLGNFFDAKNLPFLKDQL